MSMPRKTTPEKYCQFCAKLLERKRWRNGVLESLLHFNRRKFCDMTCFAKDLDVRPTKTDVKFSGAHWHSRKEVPPGPCQRCGAENALDVHHLDGDYRNNSLTNLERICRSCHNKVHRPKGSCTICGKPMKGHGFCEKHYLRWKKYGDPLAYRIPERAKCSVCGKPAHARGLCGKHYMQAKRSGTLPKK